MTREAFGGVTVIHITVALIVLFIVGIALQSLRKRQDDGESMMVSARCTGCGWTGKLSRYQRKCPRCNGEVSWN